MKAATSESLLQSVGISALVHFGILAAFVLRFLIFPAETFLLEPSVQVDLVGIPDKLTEADSATQPPVETSAAPEKEEIKKASEESKVQPEISKTIETKKSKMDDLKPEVVLSKTKPKDPKELQKKAFAKLRAMEALDRLKNEQMQSAQAKLLKGQQVAQGSDLRGVIRLQYDAYLGKVESHIKANWFRPEWMRSQHLQATVLIRADETGHLTEAPLIVKSSGNETFDQLAAETVKKSTPLPPPPEELKKIFQSRGIQLVFGEGKSGAN